MCYNTSRTCVTFGVIRGCCSTLPAGRCNYYYCTVCRFHVKYAAVVTSAHCRGSPGPYQSTPQTSRICFSKPRSTRACKTAMQSVCLYSCSDTYQALEKQSCCLICAGSPCRRSKIPIIEAHHRASTRTINTTVVYACSFRLPRANDSNNIT